MTLPRKVARGALRLPIVRLSLLVLAVAVAAPGASLAAVRAPTGVGEAPDGVARRGGFSINLYRAGDFVGQYTHRIGASARACR